MLPRFAIAVAGVLLLAWLVFRPLARRDYARRGRMSVLTLGLAIVVFALHANLLYLFVPGRWPALPDVPDAGVRGVVAGMLLVLGLGIVLTSVMSLGLGTTLGQDEGLRTRGLYRLSRNPQALGYGVALLALLVAYPSAYGIAWLAAYVLIAAWMIRTEEEHLARTYGDEYFRYARAVPRLLGRP